MLTLDTLARMADRMPSEPHGDSGSPPFRAPDRRLRIREVSLPTVADETRRATGLFGFFVSVALLTLVPTGVVVTHALDFYAGHVPLAEISNTALWFGLATLLFTVPFAGIGLIREVRRYRRARALLGASVVVHTSGLLRSEDGSASYQL